MTWLVWRRYRLSVACTIVVLGGLALWMLLLERRWMDAFRPCVPGRANCGFDVALSSTRFQIIAATVVLLALPCALGAIFGAPLVSGELERHTNRLVWTQAISRMRWLSTKAGLVVVALGLLVALLTVEAQWWTGLVAEPDFLFSWSSTGRIGPTFFPITGIAPVAYTVLAVSLGAAAGALIRRTGQAIIVTVLLYAAVAAVMLFAVRPVLAPQLFVPQQFQSSGALTQAGEPPPGSWYLGSEYRYAPNATGPHAASATEAGQYCAIHSPLEVNFTSCLRSHEVEQGNVYQPSTNYWTLQWRESAILFVLSAVCLAGATIAVRRWQA